MLRPSRRVVLVIVGIFVVSVIAFIALGGGRSEKQWPKQIWVPLAGHANDGGKFPRSTDWRSSVDEHSRSDLVFTLIDDNHAVLRELVFVPSRGVGIIDRLFGARHQSRNYVSTKRVNVLDGAQWRQWVQEEH